MGSTRLRKLRDQPVSFFVLAFLLVVSCASVARRLFDDAADGLLEHAGPDHGPRPTARPRHVRLLDDVHGHGSLRSFLRRSLGPPNRRAHHGRRRRSGLRRRRDPVRTRPARTAHRSPTPDHRPGPGRRRTRSGTERAASGRVRYSVFHEPAMDNGVPLWPNGVTPHRTRYCAVASNSSGRLDGSLSFPFGTKTIIPCLARVSNTRYAFLR